MTTRGVATPTEDEPEADDVPNVDAVGSQRLPPFARMLRELRRAAGLTQEDLAQAARVGVRTLRDLESGRAVRPQRSTVDLLVHALGLEGETQASFIALARGRTGSAPASQVSPAYAAMSVDLRPAPELIGRDAVLRDLVDLLGEASHVTLVGLAGAGKTTLAIAAGHRAAPAFSGGVRSVVVTDASNELEILASVVSTLQVARLDEVATLSRGPTLLILDAADRAPGPATAALLRLRTLAPWLTVLATSRHPLGIPGEHELPVPPLDVPSDASTEAEIFSYAAVEFFLDRLRRVRRRPVGLDEASVLSALVRRLGGLPLALEIAAARGRVLELEELLARTAAADGNLAGQSLRAAVMASWVLLLPAEQVCLSRLAGFRFRWSMHLAEEALDGALPDGADVAGMVDRFVGLGLVAMRPDLHELRFWLLDAVRDVAIEHASRRGTLAGIRDRHRTIMVRLAGRALSDVAGDDPVAVAAAERWLECFTPDVQAALGHTPAYPSEAETKAAQALRADLAAWQAAHGLGENA